MGASASSSSRPERSSTQLRANYAIESDDGQPVLLGVFFRIMHGPRTPMPRILLLTDDKLTTPVDIVQQGPDVCVAGESWRRFAVYNNLRCGYTIRVTILQGLLVKIEARDTRHKRFPTRGLPDENGLIPRYKDEPVVFAHGVQKTPSLIEATRLLVQENPVVPLLVLELSNTNIRHRKLYMPMDISVSLYRMYNSNEVFIQVNGRPEIAVQTHYNIASDGRALFVGTKWESIVLAVPLVERQICCFAFSIESGKMHITVHPM
ncbi:hypothetical protein ACP70R_006419 [Stipagrostis hirtigluma subsp. patula]